MFIHLREIHCPSFLYFMDDSAGQNPGCAVLLQKIFCVPCDASQEVRLAAPCSGSGMQLLWETSWYPEILNEKKSQIQEPCRGAQGDMGMGKGLRLLSSLLLLHCFPWGPLWAPTLLCGGGCASPARLGCTRALPFVLPLIALIWGNCRCLLPYPLISRAALAILWYLLKFIRCNSCHFLTFPPQSHNYLIVSNIYWAWSLIRL